MLIWDPRVCTLVVLNLESVQSRNFKLGIQNKVKNIFYTSYQNCQEDRQRFRILIFDVSFDFQNCLNLSKNYFLLVIIDKGTKFIADMFLTLIIYEKVSLI